MRFPIALLLTAILGTLGAGALAADMAKPTVVSADSLSWTDGTGPLKGAKVAILMGDPAKAGAFVMRIKLADGTKFGPHFHPDVENVTVISGTLLVGLGDKMDVSKMTPLKAGSFVSIPPSVHHYAMSKGETVLQFNDVGPWGMTAVK